MFPKPRETVLNMLNSDCRVMPQIWKATLALLPVHLKLCKLEFRIENMQNGNMLKFPKSPIKTFLGSCEMIVLALQKGNISQNCDGNIHRSRDVKESHLLFCRNLLPWAWCSRHSTRRYCLFICYINHPKIVNPLVLHEEVDNDLPDIPQIRPAICIKG